MKTTHDRPVLFPLVLSGLLVCLFGGSPLAADVLESARMLPDDVIVMISVESISDLRTALQKTSLYELYQDPAMKQLVGDAEKKLRERIDEAVKEFWKDTGAENPPAQLPYPQGRLVLGLSLLTTQKAAVVRPSSDSGDDEPQETGSDLEFRLVLLADMTGKTEQVRQVMRSLSTSATDSGRTIKRTEVAGVQLETIVPREDDDDPTVFYGLKDNWLVLAADATDGTGFVESVVKRIGRSLPGSLADKPGLATATRALGAAHAFLYVNADAVRSLIVGSVANKAKAEQIVAALGLKNVTGISSSVQVAGQRNQDLCAKTLIAVNGPKTGIPALLAMPSTPLRLNDRLITRDVVGFSWLNLEPARLYDGIARMIGEIKFVDINMMVQAMMAITAGEGGQPPVQLRDEVLAQLAAPLFVTWKANPTIQNADRTLEIGAAIKFLVGLSVRDASRLDAALARIHGAVLRGMPEARRELLNETIYLLPAGRASMSADSAGETGAPAGNRMAFSVAGSTLVVGPVEDVEQAIRSLQKEPDGSIASDPMFRYARAYLPSQAGGYYYRNNRLDMENAWKMIRQMAQNLPKQDQDDSAHMNVMANPIGAALRELSKYVDLSRLPEFHEIEKYWGATVGFTQDRPEGIYSESTVLKPAQP